MSEHRLNLRADLRLNHILHKAADDHERDEILEWQRVVDEL